MLTILKKKSEFFGLLFVLVITLTLRFPNLGYSDYIGDEHKAFLLPSKGQSASNFLLNQRKGPGQFFVTQATYFITQDYRNEFAMRVPFTLINTASIFVFYVFIKKVTKSSLVAFFSALFLTVNGFIVGFSRIAQYQNLNLLFSFLALYLYADIFLLDPKNISKEKTQKFLNGLVFRTMLGTISFSISLLSHWDAIFVLPVMFVFFGKFVFNSGYTKKFRIQLVLINFVIGCLALLPFLIPYINHQSANSSNKRYFLRRVQVGESDNNRYLFLLELYGPFLVVWFYSITGALSLLFIKKSYLFFIWFLFGYSLFELFVRKPGTHIYNFVIPVIVLSAIFVSSAIKFMPKYLKILPFLSAIGVVLLFFVQTYILFVDHSVEYPWQQENIFGHQTRKYVYSEKPPLFGFPHSRNWKRINEVVNSLPYDYGYFTNEDKTISEFYMDAKYKKEDKFIYIGIKRPFSFVEDWKHSHIKNKEDVYSFQNVSGENTVIIYKKD